MNRVRLVVYLVMIGLGCLALAFLAPAGVMFAIVVGLVAGFAVPLVDMLIMDRLHLRLHWYALRNWSTQIRISYSYLFRIQVGPEYLLVFGQRHQQFQPVGGVYKTHGDGKAFLKRIGALDDDYLPVDEVTERDLRIRIEGRHLPRFVAWVESMRGREVDGWREFYEEMLASNILDASKFPYIEYSFLRRVFRPLRYSQHAKSKELLIADILELEPSGVQLEELKRLKTVGDNRVLWASDTKIERLGSEPGMGRVDVIGEPAQWLLG